MRIQPSVLGVAAIFGASDGSQRQFLSASKASTTSSIDQSDILMTLIRKSD
jgi:hypothetical protein